MEMSFLTAAAGVWAWSENMFTRGFKIFFPALKLTGQITLVTTYP
jgi:hypothetical protein